MGAGLDVVFAQLSSRRQRVGQDGLQRVRAIAVGELLGELDFAGIDRAGLAQVVPHRGGIEVVGVLGPDHRHRAILQAVFQNRLLRGLCELVARTDLLVLGVIFFQDPLVLGSDVSVAALCVRSQTGRVRRDDQRPQREPRGCAKT